MVVAFSKFLTEIGLWAGFIIALGGALAVLEKIRKPFGKWVQKNVTSSVTSSIDGLTEKVQNQGLMFDAHASYVRHHLGPNGTTPPIYQRLKNLETQMNLSSVRQQKFMNALDIPIGECTTTGNIANVNRKWLELFACEEWEVIGFGWRNFISESDYETVINRMSYIVEHKTSVGSFPITVNSKKGTSTKVTSRVYPLFTDEQNLAGFLIELDPEDD
jgi:PAS domain S-box-containing protein